MTSVGLTLIVNPAGIVWVTSVPLVDWITIFVLPFSNGSIDVICPATVEVIALLLLFSPLGYTWPRPRLAPT